MGICKRESRWSLLLRLQHWLLLFFFLYYWPLKGILPHACKSHNVSSVPLLPSCFLLPFMPFSFQAARGSSVHLLLQNPFLCKLNEFFEVLLNEVSPRLLTISKKNATLSYNAQSLKSHKNTPFTVYTLRAKNLTEESWYLEGQFWREYLIWNETILISCDDDVMFEIMYVY